MLIRAAGIVWCDAQNDVTGMDVIWLDIWTLCKNIRPWPLSRVGVDLSSDTSAEDNQAVLIISAFQKKKTMVGNKSYLSKNP